MHSLWYCRYTSQELTASNLAQLTTAQLQQPNAHQIQPTTINSRRLYCPWKQQVFYRRPDLVQRQYQCKCPEYHEPSPREKGYGCPEGWNQVLGWVGGRIEEWAWTANLAWRSQIWRLMAKRKSFGEGQVYACGRRHLRWRVERRQGSWLWCLYSFQNGSQVLRILVERHAAWLRSLDILGWKQVLRNVQIRQKERLRNLLPSWWDCVYGIMGKRSNRRERHLLVEGRKEVRRVLVRQ